MIGIIGGTGLENFMKDAQKRREETDYGEVFLLVKDEIVFINRHGKNKNIAPHKINHRANIAAFKKLKVHFLLGICSVGSLKKEIAPGSILIPDDYIHLNPPTFFDSRIHITPELDKGLRKKIIQAAQELKIEVIPQGVYFQSSGPRLETKAEVKMLQKFADVVGMNLASEATLSQELKISYAGICQVDNYAHGLVKEKLDFKKIMREAEKSRKRVIALVERVTKKAI